MRIVPGAHPGVGSTNENVAGSERDHRAFQATVAAGLCMFYAA